MAKDNEKSEKLAQVSYSGDLQPSAWDLHPEDYRARRLWEAQRQQILDDQVYALEHKLAVPDEKVPPIPELKHPGWRPGIDPVDTVVHKPVHKTVHKEPVDNPPVHKEGAPKSAEARRAYKAEWMRKKREEKP